MPEPVAATHFIGTVDGELACHIVVTPRFEVHGYRATRLVTMPEWQGAGVGSKFLNFIAQYHLDGNGRGGHKYVTYFHTSHPQLCAYLRHSQKWVQVSAVLYGGNKKKSGEAIIKSQKRKKSKFICGTGYGGHFRAVQGFKYIGEQKT